MSAENVRKLSDFAFHMSAAAARCDDVTQQETVISLCASIAWLLDEYGVSRTGFVDAIPGLVLTAPRRIP